MQQKILLRHLPKGFSANPRIDPDTIVAIHEGAISNLEKGLLRINLRPQGALAQLENIDMAVGNAKGVFDLGIGSNACAIRIGSGLSGRFAINLWGKSSVAIGDDTSSNGTRIVCADSDFRCGSDCMFSDGITIQTQDQHAIVDLSTGEIVNMGRKLIQLEDHVWIGRGAMIGPRCTLGKGSIVGLGSVVTKDVPRFTAVAGVPARVVRENVTWARPQRKLDAFAEQAVAEFRRQTNDRHN